MYILINFLYLTKNYLNIFDFIFSKFAIKLFSFIQINAITKWLGTCKDVSIFNIEDSEATLSLLWEVSGKIEKAPHL